MADRFNTCITKKLNALHSLQEKVRTIGYVNNFPFYFIHIKGNTEARKNILISAGIHGDEPAGPAAVFQFLERNNTHLYADFNFYILPCINPFGFEHNKRENAEGLDLNRSLEKDDITEIIFIKNVLRDLHFDFIIDFHEDWEAVGFYLYEAKRDEVWIGPSIIENVEKIGAIDETASESDIPIYRGGSKIDPSWGTLGFASYLYHYHSDHAIISESPTSWDLDKRTNTHLATLDTLIGKERN